MLNSEMEAVLKSLDQRVGRIEQILPTLATKAELRHEIRGVRVLIEDVRGDVKLVHERLDVEMAGLNRQLDERFSAVDTRLDTMDARFQAMDARFQTMDARFQTIDARFQQMLEQFAEVFRRLDRIQPR
jgi:prefoldin subunit 5